MVCRYDAADSFYRRVGEDEGMPNANAYLDEVASTASASSYDSDGFADASSGDDDGSADEPVLFFSRSPAATAAGLSGTSTGLAVTPELLRARGLDRELAPGDFSTPPRGVPPAVSPPPPPPPLPPSAHHTPKPPVDVRISDADTVSDDSAESGDDDDSDGGSDGSSSSSQWGRHLPPAKFPSCWLSRMCLSLDLYERCKGGVVLCVGTDRMMLWLWFRAHCRYRMRFDRFETDNTESVNAQEGRGYTRAALPTLQLVHRGHHSGVQGDRVYSFWQPHGRAEPARDGVTDPLHYVASQGSQAASSGGNGGVAGAGAGAGAGMPSPARSTGTVAADDGVELIHITHLCFKEEIRLLLTPEVIEATTVLCNELVPEAKSVPHVMSTFDTSIPNEQASREAAADTGEQNRMLVTVPRVEARLIHCATIVQDAGTTAVPLVTPVTACVDAWMCPCACARADDASMMDDYGGDSLTATYCTTARVDNLVVCMNQQHKRIDVPLPHKPPSAKRPTVGFVPSHPPARSMLFDTTTASAKVQDVHVEIEFIEYEVPDDLGPRGLRSERGAVSMVDIANPSQQGFVGMSNKWLARIERGASGVPNEATQAQEAAGKVQDEVVLVAVHLENIDASYIKKEMPMILPGKHKAVIASETCINGIVGATRAGCLDEALPTALGTAVAWKDAVDMFVHKVRRELVQRRAVQDDWLRQTLRSMLAEPLREEVERRLARRKGQGLRRAVGRAVAAVSDGDNLELAASRDELDIDWFRNPYKHLMQEHTDAISFDEPRVVQMHALHQFQPANLLCPPAIRPPHPAWYVSPVL